MKKIVKDYLKLGCFYAGRIVLRGFYIFPVKKNRVAFISMAGKQYSCNPRYITEYMLKEFPGKYEIVWSIRNPELMEDLKNKEVKIVKYRSLAHYYYKLTAKASVCNSHWGNELPSRKSQMEIYTGHGGGGGTKKGGKDDKTIQDNKAHYIGYLLDSHRYKVMMASSRLMLENTCRNGLHFYGPVIGGTPRNDILLNRDHPELITKVRDYFRIDEKSKILLYAPTWRNNGDESKYYTIDYSRLKSNMEKRFGGNWVVLMRLHNLVSKDVLKGSKGVIDATDYPDMHELLYVVDAVISDYSSFVWDYTFTYRPCFLYCADLEKYQEERGFNTPIETWGFPVCKDNDELEKAILEFDEDSYLIGLKKRQDYCGSFEVGTATRDVTAVIESACFGDGSIPASVKLVN